MTTRKHQMSMFLRNFAGNEERLMKFMELMLLGDEESAHNYMSRERMRRICVVLTTKCNLKCVWCHRNEARFQEYLHREMPFEMLEAILPGLEGFETLHYGGLGEPLFYSRLYDAIKLATKEAMAQVGRVTRTIADRCIASAPELSEKYLRQSLEAKKGMLDKSDIETFNRLGITLRKQGKWDQAVEEYRKALKISPNDAGLYYNMSMAYGEGRQFQDAFNYLDKALRINPDLWNANETVCVNIAMIYFRAARKEQAADFLQKALGINPNFERAKAMLREMK